MTPMEQRRAKLDRVKVLRFIFWFLGFEATIGSCHSRLMIFWFAITLPLAFPFTLSLLFACILTNCSYCVVLLHGFSHEPKLELLRYYMWGATFISSMWIYCMLPLKIVKWAPLLVNYIYILCMGLICIFFWFVCLLFVSSNTCLLKNVQIVFKTYIK